MLKAVIFDFDGIIAHTEPLHLKAFQATLSDYGIVLTEKEYYERYLAYDDKTLFRQLLQDREFKHGEQLRNEMMRVKSAHYEELIRGNMELLPGAEEFIKEAGGKYPLAIGSGALRAEIVDILGHAGLQSYFKVIVSAEDVERSKPAPDVFIEALSRINQAYPDSGIFAQDCLVIEDSLAGIEAALSAEMKCLAITNSYPRDMLSQAQLIKDSLIGLGVDELEALFR